MEKSNAAHGRIEKEIGVLKERIGSLKDKTEKRAKELAQAAESLNGRIKKAGFKDEADFLSARLSDEERGLLADEERALVKEKTELDARKKDKIKSLTSERNKRLTDATAVALADNIRTCDSELKQIRIDIGGIEKSLKDALDLWAVKQK